MIGFGATRLAIEEKSRGSACSVVFRQSSKISDPSSSARSEKKDRSAGSPGR